MSLIDGQSESMAPCSSIPFDALSGLGSDGPRCHGCLKSGTLPKTYHGFAFHDACLLGVRSRHRQLRKSSIEAKCDDITMMAQNPQTWRTNMKPYLNANRTAAIRDTKRVVAKVHAKSKVI
jgi:hypothetical protein